MNRARVLLIAPTACLAIAAAPGCEAPSAPSSEAASEREMPEEGGTFRLLTQLPVSLDPPVGFDASTGNIIYQLFDGLVRLDVNLNPIPALAESWKVSRDGLTYTMRLRPNVRFHDGSLLGPEDVVYSYKRILKLSMASPSLGLDSLRLVEGLENWQSGNADARVAIEAPDPKTVVIRLRQKAPYFLASLADTRLSIVPKSVVERVGDAEFGRRPVGTGPFRFESWESHGVRLVRFDDHFRGAPLLDAVEFRAFPMTPGDTPLALLERGELDLAQAFERVDRPEANERRGPIVRHRNPGIYFLGFNIELEPLDDARVRRAIGRAIDRSRLTTTNPNRPATEPVAASGFVPPGLRGYSPDRFVPPFDPSAARRLLKEAGFEEDEEIGPIPLWSLGPTPDEEKIVSNLREIGIRVRPKAVHWFELQRALSDGRVSMFILGDLAFLPDAAPMLDTLFRSNGVANFFNYSNPAVDQLIDLALESYDSERHLEICRQIQTLVASDMPCVPLYFDSEAFAVSQRVRDLELSPFGLNHIHLGRTWLATR